VSATAITACWS